MSAVTVNDIHSELNETVVGDVVPVESLESIQEAISGAGAAGTPVALAGGRHAMGGQQFCAGGRLIDTRSLDRVLAFDEERGIIEVEAGIQWPALLDYLGPTRWAVAQKQTGADRLSIGGAISANVHGRGLIMKPLIDDLGGTPRVMMLNGGEEDNNAFLFRDGYAATVEAKVDAGEWELVDDQFVPGWGANGEGQQIMEQVLADNNNKVDAVFAANDNLATQAINALEAAGVGPVPLSGQDATAAGIQQIILGQQTMTVYKPIQAEADVAAKAALALCAGEDPTAIDSEFEFASIGIQAEDGKPTDTPTGEGVVPYLAETPVGVTVDNIMDTVIADEFLTIDEICTGDTADTDFCKENG